MCGLVGPDKNSLTLNTRRCPDWFMPNSGGNGYFRWNTDAKQWQGLLDVFSELQNGEQIALLDSAIAGFEAGTIDLQTMLRAVEYSSQSPLRQIVTFPLDSLDHYLEKVIDPEQAVPLRSQLTSWYLDKLATLETPADDNEALLKNRLLDFMALSLKHQPTRTRLADQALEFMAADGKPEAEALSSDLYLAAFTSGVQDLGKSFFDQLIGARNTIDDPLFDEASAGAMGAFRDASLVEQAHHYAMSEHIGARESFAMIGSMLREPGLQEIHWQWYKASLSEILGKIPSQWRRHSPRFAGVFCDLARVPELEGLFARHGDAAPGYELALSQTREQISLCVALRTNYRR
jgi:alanyl aminopeptidase